MKQQLQLAETCWPSPGSIAPYRGQLRAARPGDDEVVVRPTGRAAGAGRLLRVHPCARRGVRPLETDAAGRHFPRRAASGELSEGDAPCGPCSPERTPHRFSRLPTEGVTFASLYCNRDNPCLPCSRERASPPPPPSPLLVPWVLRVSCLHPCNAMGTPGVTRASPSARFRRAPSLGTEGLRILEVRGRIRVWKEVKFSPGVSVTAV